MKATITGNKSNARNMDNDKERIATLTLVACVKGTPKEVAQARFYMSRSADGAGPVYCSVWTYGAAYSSGHGIARGYGYHKQSAALERALCSAGVVLSEAIGGRGDGMMRDALIAVGVALGHKASALGVIA